MIPSRPRPNDRSREARSPEPVFAAPPDRRLEWLDHLASWLDNRFRIPFTNIRFGADALIGLIPYVGDMLSLLLSILLVFLTLRYRVSGKVLSLMAGNILLDALLGSVPLLGDLFDIRYRANRRNLLLLRDHLNEGRHHGSGRGPVLLFFALVFGLLAGLIYVFWLALQWLVG
ncbi:MAG: DUF4112 domain-containing protein [Saprospiraceae bacterium]|nr:DUF4112 domain-containing protein [Saprospiraceae bacterium]MCB0625942.1 DUF4112 domain-containing protein [Saprospiraceae bacterium]MCB0677724.1 DUF4112 domain-containing protein [Saprospiraceae bacterium]MCB0680339.1 DUF4112 domain-containing protein [Saprospiraceae bacterium]